MLFVAFLSWPTTTGQIVHHLMRVSILPEASCGQHVTIQYHGDSNNRETRPNKFDSIAQIKRVARGTRLQLEHSKRCN